MRRRGMTLLELIVSVVVFSLLLSTVSYILVNVFRCWTRELSRADAQNGMLVALAELTTGLQSTDSRSMTLFDATGFQKTDANPAAGVAFLATSGDVPMDPSGNLQWNRFEIWYAAPDTQSPTGQSLWCQTIPVPAGTAPNPYRLQSFVPGTPRKRVISGVVSFQIAAPVNSSPVNSSQAALWSNPVAISLAAKCVDQTLTNVASARMMENKCLSQDSDE